MIIKNRILYLLILIIATSQIILNQGKSAYIMFYTIVLLPFISVLLAFIFIQRLVIKQTVDRGSILKGEETFYRIRAVNKSLLFNPETIFIFHNAALTDTENIAIEFESQDKALSFLPLSKRHIEFILRCHYRGSYEIGLSLVQVRDYLGLFQLTRKLDKSTQILVYPRVIELNNFPLSINISSKSFSRFDIRDEDYSSIADVRPYESFDSVKKIHWKLSSKRNEWIVKDFESNSLNSIVFFLDTQKIATPSSDIIKSDIIKIEDKIIEIAVSSSYFCLKKQLPIEFHYGTEKLNISNITNFEKLYSLCAHLQFNNEENIKDMIVPFLHSQTNSLNIIFITPRLNESLLDELKSAWIFGHYITLIYVQNKTEIESHSEALSFLSESGMPCYFVKADSDIKELF